MKTFQLHKANLPLHGEITLLGDKSLAHRAMLFSALAKGKSTITNFPDSGVTRTLMKALVDLGVDIRLQDSTLEVIGNGYKRFKNSNARCNCEKSATTMRLLAGAIAGTKSTASLDGSESLRKRPFRLDGHFTSLGYCNVESNNGYLPVCIHEYEKSDDDIASIDTKCKSALVKTALILLALGRSNRTTISEQIKTRDHTERMLRMMGADIEVASGDEYSISVNPLKKELLPLNIELPGDISSAAFILVAAAIVPNSDVTVKDVLLNELRLGFIKALEDAGCIVDIVKTKQVLNEDIGNIRLRSPKVLNPIVIDDLKQVADMIDEFPAIAALMACINGISTVHNAKELRYKESDRIKSILSAYQMLNLNYHEYDDGFSVLGQRYIKNATISAFDDHRIAMAFSLLGLVSDVDVDDEKIISLSFPNFKHTIESMMK